MSDLIIVPVMIGPPSHRGELMLPAMRGQRVSRRPGDRRRALASRIRGARRLAWLHRRLTRGLDY